MVVQAKKRLPVGERRERILSAALEVFAARGYAEGSVAQIAAKAGITPAVIYDHFASKAELHATLLESQAEALMESVTARVLEAPDDPGERLRAGVDAFFAFVEQNHFAWWLLFRDPPSDPAISSAYERIQQSATAGIAALLRANASPVALRRRNADRDLEMFAQLLRTAQNGLAAWWHEHPETPRAVLVDRVVEFCWTGLERVAGGERSARA